MLAFERIVAPGVTVCEEGAPIGLGHGLAADPAPFPVDGEDLDVVEARRGALEAEAEAAARAEAEAEGEEYEPFSFHRDGKLDAAYRAHVLEEHGVAADEVAEAEALNKRAAAERAQTTRSESGKKVIAGEDSDEVEAWERQVEQKQLEAEAAQQRHREAKRQERLAAIAAAQGEPAAS